MSPATIPSPHDGAPRLTEVQRLPTNGARAVEPFSRDGMLYLAIPQLAYDIAGQPAAITGGDSDTVLTIYRWHDGLFIEHQKLPVPGGEDAEFFEIGDRAFLATASLRSGAGPYRMKVESVLYEWVDGRFTPFQKFETVAAKQWRHFRIGERHFLALAQGALPPGKDPADNLPSRIFEWNGIRFDLLQEIESAWGYNWAFSQVGGHDLLAYADHVTPSLLLRWNGSQFEEFQRLEGATGRAFSFFRARGHTWLAFACLHANSTLYRWEDGRFVVHQLLSGPGGREFAWLPAGGDLDGGLLVQANFILGTREAPLPQMDSLVHAFRGDLLTLASRFPTTGGADVSQFEVADVTYLAVANALSPQVRFRTDSVIYRVDGVTLRNATSPAIGQ